VLKNIKATMLKPNTFKHILQHENYYFNTQKNPLFFKSNLAGQNPTRKLAEGCNSAAT
jgi:hypothetical protein